MHGLINRSIQSFLCDTYGSAAWSSIMAAADLGFENFETLSRYDHRETDAVLDAASGYLSTSRGMLLEDLGIYLVSHPNMQSLRRLLRFGGDSFVEFLLSLDELHDRAKLAVSDLILPVLDLRDHSSSDFTLTVTHPQPGFGHVMVGVLRAMADDYGALALLEFQGRKDGVETIIIELLESSFAEGREFALAVQA